MDFFDVATTTPTVRRFLDRPVSDAMIERVLETANMAPSGSNAQPWEFVVVRSEQKRRAIRALSEEVWGPYTETAIIRGLARDRAGAYPGLPRSPQNASGARQSRGPDQFRRDLRLDFSRDRIAD